LATSAALHVVVFIDATPVSEGHPATNGPLRRPGHVAMTTVLFIADASWTRLKSFTSVFTTTRPFDRPSNVATCSAINPSETLTHDMPLSAGNPGFVYMVIPLQRTSPLD